MATNGRGNGGQWGDDLHEDAARLFRALNRLVHEPSADARRQAEAALHLHKAMDPAWWDDAVRGAPGVVASATASYSISRG